MNFTRPTSRYGAPPARLISPSLAPSASETPRGDFRERLAAQFLARMLPGMTPDERFAFEERVAICMFDGNLAEADAVRVALNDCAAQRARGEQCARQ
jgi:hypothetical protein